MPKFSDVSIDKVRQYWDGRPCNIRHSPADVGTRKYFDQVEARKYFIEPHIPHFAEFERWRGKRVLEIGCGIGTDTINFARAGAQVTAVDLSPRSLELTRQRAQVYGLGNIELYCADAEELSAVVPPQPYDLVYSFGVLHHTPHPERSLEEIRRHYVAPGSIVKIMVYHRFSWKVLGIVISEGRGAFWKLDELVARSSEAETGCPVTYTYSRAEAWRLLAGLEVIDVWVDHIFPYRVKDYVRYRYVRAFPFNIIKGRLFRAVERLLGWHMCITARVPEGGLIAGAKPTD